MAEEALGLTPGPLPSARSFEQSMDFLERDFRVEVELEWLRSEQQYHQLNLTLGRGQEDFGLNGGRRILRDESTNTGRERISVCNEGP